jgi:hippurate hydrolase
MGRRLGIRADMDALPIHEADRPALCQRNAGVMHACGHDGHTAILLAAARYLAQHGDFDGTLHLIFQPAEEIGAGAKKMIADGLFERFPVRCRVRPAQLAGRAAGQFGFVSGPAMASVDQAEITVRRQGRPRRRSRTRRSTRWWQRAFDHGAAERRLAQRRSAGHGRGHGGLDPRRLGLQRDSRQRGAQADDPRAFRPEVREQLLQQRIPALARAQAESFGAQAEVDYRLGFPAWSTTPPRPRSRASVALDSFGATRSMPLPPRTASEDFAFMLQARPGSYLFVGNGDSAPLHSPHYDFNDAIIAPAATYWARLAERFLA